MKNSLFVLLLIPFIVLAQSCSDSDQDEATPVGAQNPGTIDNSWLVPVQ